MRPGSILGLGFALAAAARAPAYGQAAEPGGLDPIAGYLKALEESRRLPPEAASIDRLKEQLAAAEERLIQGDARVATSLLFGVVESTRYATWRDHPAFANAEFLLGRALLRGAAFTSAERYLGRALARGPKSLYFVPACRSLADLAIAIEAHARIADVIEAGAGGEDLPDDCRHEVAYLRGRAAYDAGDLGGAAKQLRRVGRTSRFYAGAAYFRGLIAARGADYDRARDAFCEIVGRGKGSRLPFYVDGRYPQLQDLARLALGRIAHEQDKYDEAYYFYFSIPDDSDRLAEALYEAAWSMFQKNELGASKAFIEQFDRLFPQSPLGPEVAFLRVNLALRTCAFDEARAEAAALLRVFAPLYDDVQRAQGDGGRRQALLARLLAPEARVGPASDRQGQLVQILRLDRRFAVLLRSIRELDGDIDEAARSLMLWHGLAGAAESKQAPAPSSSEAAALLADVQSLAALPADPALRGRVAALLARATRAAHPAGGGGLLRSEVLAAEELLDRLVALRAHMVNAAERLVVTALRDVEGRLRVVLRQVRLANIDAVVGKKKKLELEIANLYEGKFPPELFYRLQAEGAIADDEEYWPFEGDYWADEYENYR